MNAIQVYDVKPFGKFPLGGCFEEAYVSALSAFEISPFFYLVNEVNELGKNEVGLFFRNGRKRPLHEVEKELGIESIRCRVTEKIVDFTIQSLIDGNLLIVRVRGLSGTNIETGRKTQRSFSEHWILVYGYEEREQQLVVLEHNNNVSARYAPCKISVSEYERAYSLAQHKEESYTDDIYIIKRKSKVDTSKKGKIYKRYLNDYVISSKTENLMLNTFLTNVDLTSTYISILNEVIKKYQKEKWIEEEVGNSVEAVDLLLRELFLLRTYCIKAQFFGLDRPDERIMKHANKAIECGALYYSIKEKQGL